MSDYLYGSARVRALENRLLGKERMLLLADEPDAAGVWARLCEYGLEPMRDNAGQPLREETLTGLLRAAYHDVREDAPDDAALTLWLYPYDCNNLKAALKCFERGISPDPMLFDFGTVSLDAVKRATENGNFSPFPPAMARAASEARAAYAATRNPQVYDFYLDRACYTDMLSASSGHTFLHGLVQYRADLTDLVTLVRLLRMTGGNTMLSGALLGIGTLTSGYLEVLFSGGESALWLTLKSADFERFAFGLHTDSPLWQIERSADNAFMSKLREVKFMSFGAEVPAAYLLATEFEVKNLRILLSGKAAGLSGATLRERMRDSYV